MKGQKTSMKEEDIEKDMKVIQERIHCLIFKKKKQINYSNYN